MNRRGFLGALLAAPIAAVAGLRLKKRPWYFGDGLRHRPTATWTHQFLDPPNDNPNWLADLPKTKPDIDYTWRKVNGDLWGKA